MRNWVLALALVGCSARGSQAVEDSAPALPGDVGPVGAVGGAGANGKDGANGRDGVDTFDVTRSGCTPAAIPDDDVDDAPAFACALAKLATKGGLLTVPAGRFDIRSTIVVPPNVTIAGSGFGTTLAQPHALLAPLVRLGRASGLRDLSTEQEQPLPADGWTPNSDYDFQISVEGDQTTLQNLRLLNPYLGIRIAPADPNGAVGQVQLFDIRAQPLAIGLRIDRALDVIHVEELHFWPFWSAAPSVLQWTAQHGIALESLRNDNPLFSKMFFFGYLEGVRFGASPGGITSKPKISQMDCDACGMGIHVTGAGTKGILIDQLSTQGIANDWNAGTAGGGIFVEADGTTLSLEQGDFAVLAINAIRVQGAGGVIEVGSTLVREWNRTELGFPAFEVVAGSTSTLRVHDGATGNGHGAVVGGPGVVLNNVQTGANL